MFLELKLFMFLDVPCSSFSTRPIGSLGHSWCTIQSWAARGWSSVSVSPAAVKQHAGRKHGLVYSFASLCRRNGQIWVKITAGSLSQAHFCWDMKIYRNSLSLKKKHETVFFKNPHVRYITNKKSPFPRRGHMVTFAVKMGQKNRICLKFRRTASTGMHRGCGWLGMTTSALVAGYSKCLCGEKQCHNTLMIADYCWFMDD